MSDPNVLKKMIEILSRPDITFRASTGPLFWDTNGKPTSDMKRARQYSCTGLVRAAIDETYPPYNPNHHYWYEDRALEELYHMATRQWWRGEVELDKPDKDKVLKMLHYLLETGIDL